MKVIRSEERIYQSLKQELHAKRQCIKNASLPLPKSSPSSTKGSNQRRGSVVERFVPGEDSEFHAPTSWKDRLIVLKRQWELTYYYSYETHEKYLLYFIYLSVLFLVIYYFL